MENKEKIDLIIEKLRESKPQISRETELTDRIMERINAGAPRSVTRSLTILQLLSTAAAVFLVVLFAVQFFLFYNGTSPVPVSRYEETCIDTSFSSRNEIIERKRLDAYVDHLKSNSEKNRQLKELLKITEE